MKVIMSETLYCQVWTIYLSLVSLRVFMQWAYDLQTTKTGSITQRFYTAVTKDHHWAYS
jgi:hypothetical protein